MKNFFLSCKEIRIEPTSPKTYYGCFYLGPFTNGQGLTVANALRRTLLADLTGLAITSAKIEGVSHEYATIAGVRETALDILLNLKEISIQKKTKDFLTETQLGYLQVRGPGTVRASGLRFPPNFQAVDPDQYIATLSENGSLNVVFTIDEGKGFILRKNEVTFSNIDKSSEIPGSAFLPIDAIFTPIKKVNYIVEAYGSETLQPQNQIVVVEVWTNGCILPQEAMSEGLNILRILFGELGKLKVLKSIFTTSVLKTNKKFKNVFKNVEFDLDLFEDSFENSSESEDIVTSISNFKPTFTQKDLKQKQRDVSTLGAMTNLVDDWSNRTIDELKLPFRLFYILYRAKILTVGEILESSTSELQKLPGFGLQSILLLKQILKSKGLSLKT
jgi:DNA-directed RNA polymerase subunit alpha